MLGKHAIAALCLTAGCAHAQQSFKVDLGWDRGEYAVESPDAVRSAAQRLGTDLANKQGDSPPATSGYVLTSTVIVVARDRSWADGMEPERIEGLDGVWFVQTTSVRTAVALAGRLPDHDAVEAAYLDAIAPWSTRGLDDDPMLAEQWTLRNEAYPVADARVADAWDLGVNGEGVVIGVLERTIDTDHPDLAGRFAVELSTQQPGEADTHSTAVAGIALAERNGVGMVGAAPGARLASMPVGTTLDTVRSILHARDRVPIKLGTWGRSDRQRLSRLDPATREALALSAQTTSIVWAAGNGGPSERMDYDALAANRFVLPVTAVGDLDLRASYGERGSAHLVCAHSSGNARSVVATLPGGEWTARFGGTSAAAPLAAGAIALALEANPDLTPRDIEHLLVRSARRLDERSGLWHANSAGTEFSELHGFGAIDAARMVEMARAWEPVGPLAEWTSGERTVDLPLADADHAHDEIDALRAHDDGRWVEQRIEGPAGMTAEHVEVVLSVDSTYIGDLAIEVVSPSGTVAVLAEPRNDAQDDLRRHVFLSRNHWGEDAGGEWAVRMVDGRPGDEAVWRGVELRIYGASGVAP